MDDKVNILLVDDRPENLLALEACLEGLGQRLIRASSGEEALRWLLKEDFAVILLDVQMPGLNGYQTAELIKSRDRTRFVPIIFLTAMNKTESSMFKGYSVGAVDYLFKPFDPEILRSKVAVFVELFLKNKQIERQSLELAQQRTFNELILDSVAGGIYGLDCDGIVTFINPAGARLLGYDVDELIGKHLHETVHYARPDGSPYPEKECPLQLAAMLGKPCRLEDEVFWRKDGTSFPVECVGTPLKEGNQIVGTVVAFIDITERKRAERELERHTFELERANRELREIDRYKDEFLSVISHELRTPLNFIMGFASILDDEVAGPLSTQQHTYLGKILNGADRMLVLVNDLLDLAKFQAGRFELYYSLQEYLPLVDEVVTTLKPLADQKRITLMTEIPENFKVWVDAPRIVQLITNLVGNAIKFTPDEGAVLVSAWREDDHLITEVTDSGIGVAADDLPKLFVRFKQLDMSATREAGGTGLGLSICKALVEAHGGTISVMSDGIGKGTTFRFVLPLTQVQIEPQSEIPQVFDAVS